MRPMARTLKFFREQGFTIDVVERWIGGYTRKDFLGCIDAIAFKKGKTKILAIQVFGVDWSSHRKKIIDEQHEGGKLWLANKNVKFIFIGWRKVKLKRGGKAIRWKPRFGRVTMTKKGKLKLKEYKELSDML